MDEENDAKLMSNTHTDREKRNAKRKLLVVPPFYSNILINSQADIVCI